MTEDLTPSTPGTLPSGSGVDLHAMLKRIEGLLSWTKDHLIQQRQPGGDQSDPATLAAEKARVVKDYAKTGATPNQVSAPDAGGMSAEVLARAASRTPTQYQQGNPGGAQSLPPVGGEVQLPPIGGEVTTAGERPPDFRTTNEKDAAGDAVIDRNAVLDAALTLWKHFKNENNVSAIGQLLPFPKKLGGGGVPVPKSIGGSGMDATAAKFAPAFFDRMQEVKAAGDASWSHGDYGTAVRHYVDWLTSVVTLGGSMTLDKAADETQAGGLHNIAAGTGDAVGLGTATMIVPKFAPKVIDAVRNRITLPAVAPNPNPAEVAAVKFGQERRVPIDAATATGNRAVRGAQYLADRSIGGSMVAGKATQAQGEALARVGGDLATESRASAVTSEQAGANITTSLESKVQAHAAMADAAYSRLRELEAQRPLAVDLTGTKAALRPVYDQMRRQMPVTQQQASAGLRAIENIVNGPNSAPLSQVEADLGAIKSLARGADMPELRTVSQGLAANGVKTLQRAVDAAAVRGGPDAVRALQQGRSATAAKFATADVLDKLRAEPVQAYRQAIAPKDSGIEFLRTLQSQAPQTVPSVARAWIDQSLDMATAEGGFDRAARLQAEWQKLGPETKRILFPAEGQIDRLDRFFLLAKKIGENPNPSGTGAVVSLAAQGAGMGAALFTLNWPALGVGTGIEISATALSVILRSPKAVKLLTEGLSLARTAPRSARTVQAAAMAKVLDSGRTAGIDLRPPAAESSEPQRNRDQ